jgi:hypothetical protein
MSDGHTADIRIYPNPNKGSFTTSFEVTDDTHVQLMLTDLSGKVLRTISRNVTAGLYEDQQLSDGLHLTSGIYLVHFRISNMPPVIQKVVVSGH